MVRARNDRRPKKLLYRMDPSWKKEKRKAAKDFDGRHKEFQSMAQRNAKDDD